MTTGTYTPAVLPSKLIANLVDSYWDTKGGSVPKPMILEKPAPEYQRVDTRNMHFGTSDPDGTIDSVTIPNAVARFINFDNLIHS